jgi:transposase InsO family protein
MQEIKCPHCGQAFTIDEAGYTAFVTDVCAKKSVGWAVSATMRTEGLPLWAFNHAVWQCNSGLFDLVHHTDRGSQGAP